MRALDRSRRGEQTCGAKKRNRKIKHKLDTRTHVNDPHPLPFGFFVRVGKSERGLLRFHRLGVMYADVNDSFFGQQTCRAAAQQISKSD